MQEWYSASDLLSLNCRLLPSSERSLYRYLKGRAACDDDSFCRARSAQGGGKEYHIKVLPLPVQDILRKQAELASDIHRAEISEAAKRSALWGIYQHASEAAKAEAQRRVVIARRATELSTECQKAVAYSIVAQEEGVSVQSVRRYVALVAGHDRSDWLALLTPRHVGGQASAECDPRALEMLKSDYYRPERPSFQSCYDRMVEAAEHNGWGAIPTAKTLKRRIEKEVGVAAGIMMREGRRAAERLHPSLTRRRDHLTAMEAVNADGHVWDIATLFEDGSIGRAIIVAFQDLYSGMILSHRIARTESQELIRLALADMVESWGIPQHCYFDNGKAFMAKMLVGRMKFRFRFKVKDEDPTGILENLGVKVHPVRPYHGQSKPVERAWRDFADRIAKHPRMAGAYMGNKPTAKPENYGARAIPIAELREFVAGEVRRHNMRYGRTSHTAKGRSLWETFRESYEAPTTLVRRATEAQREFFLLAGMGIAARRPNGEINLAGNRYWNERLIPYAGRKLMVRFDPDNLHDDLLVYTLAGEPICAATCLAPEGFDNMDAAREIERKRKAYLRALREMTELHRTLTASEVADLIPDAPDLPSATPGVVKVLRGNTVRVRKAQEETAADADAFMRGVERMVERMSGEVLSFPKEKGDA